MSNNPSGIHASAGTAYLSGAAGIVITRILSLAAGALSLWLLSRLLETAAFAAYSASMSIVMLFGFGVGFGIERTMLLKIAGQTPGDAKLQGARMMRRVGSIVLLTGTFAGVAAAVLWSEIPALSGETPIAAWMNRLWPIIPATALTLALVTWYQANHIFGFPQSLWGVTDMIRCGGFVVIFALGLGASWIAVSAVVASLLPIVVLVVFAIGKSASDPSSIGLRDVTDGFQFFVMRFSRLAMIHVDILILGIFAPASSVAQYAVASRLAAILETGHQIFTPAYAARARGHIVAGTPEKAWQEYETARKLGLIATLPVICLFLFFGHDLLALFGDFGVAFVPFALLMAGHLLNVGFGNHSIHLSMTNNLPFASLNRTFCLATFVALLLVLVPLYGAVGAGGSFLAALALYHLVGAVLLARRQKFRIITPLPASILVVSLGALALAVLHPEIAGVSSALTACAALVLMAAERHLLRSILKEMRVILTS